MDKMIEKAMLIDGKWSESWQPVQSKDEKGGFVRQTSSFRHWVTPTGEAGSTGNAGFKAEMGRYHLYVALICPWASRTLMARELKGLSHAISISIVDPVLTEQGWKFIDGHETTIDHLHHKTYIHEIYTLADPHVSGRATVPVLWDKKLNTIVNNESADIVRMMNSGFGGLASDQFDLYPSHLTNEIDRFNERIYHTLNNGVYRAGFATTQVAYDEAVQDVFNTLEWLEILLSQHRFTMGELLTESDLRLFVTLIRFDVAYHGIFKCNLKRIADYLNLSRYVQEMLNIPKIAKTVNIDHIKQGYYSIRALNPNGIVPQGPQHNFTIPNIEILQ